MSARDSVRSALTGQREAIVEKIEEAALAMMSDPDVDADGAPLVAAVLRQAADIARYAIYEPGGEQS